MSCNTGGRRRRLDVVDCLNVVLQLMWEVDSCINSKSATVLWVVCIECCRVCCDLGQESFGEHAWLRF